MGRDLRPTPSTMRNVVHLLQTKHVAVLPSEWDAEYTLEQANKWLRTMFMEGKLIKHASLGVDGIVGAECRVIVAVRVETPGQQAPARRRSGK